MRRARFFGVGVAAAVLAGVVLVTLAEEKPASSYAPVVDREEFEKTVARMEAEKPQLAERQTALLQERYDLADKPAKGVAMSRGKPVQEGVRVKLPPASNRGKTWPPLRPKKSARSGSGRRASCPCPIRIMRKAACCSPSITSTR